MAHGVATCIIHIWSPTLNPFKQATVQREETNRFLPKKHPSEVVKSAIYALKDVSWQQTCGATEDIQQLISVAGPDV